MRSVNNMSSLKGKKCFPCEDGNKDHLLSKEEIGELLAEVKDWKLDHGGKSISKEFKFADFVKAVSFVNQVADVAEEEGHHPDISINYDKVLLTLTTHSVGGLTQNDFIVASRTDNLWLI